MPDALEYQPPPPTLVAPTRWGVAVGWGVFVALDLALVILVLSHDRRDFGALACVGAFAILPLLMLLKELGVYNPRRLPDPRRFGGEIERQLRGRLRTPCECQAAGLDALLPPQRQSMLALSVEFKQAGLSHVGDYVDHAARRANPAKEHLARVFAAPDDPRWIVTLTVSGDRASSVVTIVFRSELEDGAFVLTTDSKVVASAPRPKDDDVALVPSEWDAEKMMRRHISRLDDLARAGRPAGPTISLEDACNQDDRDRLRRQAWCDQHGYVTPEHVQAVMEAAGWIPELRDVAVHAMVEHLRANPRR